MSIVLLGEDGGEAIRAYPDPLGPSSDPGMALNTAHQANFLSQVDIIPWTTYLSPESSSLPPPVLATLVSLQLVTSAMFSQQPVIQGKSYTISRSCPAALCNQHSYC